MRKQELSFMWQKHSVCAHHMQYLNVIKLSSMKYNRSEIARNVLVGQAVESLAVTFAHSPLLVDWRSQIVFEKNLRTCLS